MDWLRDALVALGLTVALSVPAVADVPEFAKRINTLNLTAYRSGTMPPDFSGQTLDAKPLSMASLRGKVVVLNFFASWCAECRPEMPVLDRLQRELAPQGLMVIGINAREDAATVRQYAKQLNLTFPLVLDPAGKINQAYGVIGIPATFVVARDGRAVAFAIGVRDWGGATARALLEALLAEPAARAGRP